MTFQIFKQKDFRFLHDFNPLHRDCSFHGTAHGQAPHTIPAAAAAESMPAEQRSRICLTKKDEGRGGDRLRKKGLRAREDPLAGKE